MQPSSTIDRDAPFFEGDLFSRDALENPFPIYRQLRDLGPVVRLGDPDFWAIGRFADVQTALRSADSLISGKGVGLNETINMPRESPNTITSDGQMHTKLRAQVSPPLFPRQLAMGRDDLKAQVSRQVEKLRGAGWVDGIRELAAYLPLSAVAHLVGLPESDHGNMLKWASASFNVIGSPSEDLVAHDLSVFQNVRRYLDEIDPAVLRPGSWSAELFERVKEGKLSHIEAHSVLTAYVVPSLDTTIYASGSLLFNIGAAPDQWAMLKADPTLVPSAVLESVRHSAVVRWFTRVAACDYSVDGFLIPAGTRVLLLYGSANRDERRYPDPDRFDVTRNPTDQLGWGSGPHMCVGMHLAKIEMQVLLEALVEQVDSIEVGEPVLGHNYGLYGIDSLPIRLT